MRIKLFGYSVVLVTAGIFLGIGVTGTAAVILGSDVFPDVRSGMYYDDAIGKLSSAGVINGYDNGNFGPDDFVTRGQVAVLMQRLRADLVGSGIAQESSDSSSSLAASLTGGTDDDEDTTDTGTTTAQSEPTSAGAMRFTIDHYSVDEDAGMARISVVRTGGRTGAVTVDYTVAEGTATAGEDYEVISGTLRFSNNETSITFVVRILNDNLEEGDETITVVLSEPTGGATLTTPSTAVLTIKDDEQTTSSGGDSAAISFGALGYDVAENGGSIAITVERSNDTGAASVDFATSNGTASSSNYTPASGTLSFAAGESKKTFTIDIRDNENVNGNKTVNLRLISPTGAVLGTSSAILTIADDEVDTFTFGSGSIKFARSMYEATEASEKAVIEVSRSKGTDGIVTVEYSTDGGTAVAGYDYEVVSGTITFQSGESKKSFIVPIIKDELNDSGEMVNLKLKNPTDGAVLMSPTTATLEIQ